MAMVQWYVAKGLASGIGVGPKTMVCDNKTGTTTTKVGNTMVCDNGNGTTVVEGDGTMVCEAGFRNWSGANMLQNGNGTMVCGETGTTTTQVGETMATVVEGNGTMVCDKLQLKRIYNYNKTAPLPPRRIECHCCVDPLPLGPPLYCNRCRGPHHTRCMVDRAHMLCHDCLDEILSDEDYDDKREAINGDNDLHGRGQGMPSPEFHVATPISPSHAKKEEKDDIDIEKEEFMKSYVSNTAINHMDDHKTPFDPEFNGKVQQNCQQQ